MKIPVLLLTCNRPYQTSKVFEAIRRIKPERLYISQDSQIQEVKDVIDIDWYCYSKYRQSEKPSGCKEGELKGINWFFEHEEMGIILEDDTVPDLSFFHFAEEMLNKYRNDKRVWQISGTNHLDEWIGNGSYFFSQNIHCWGWATWKDRWNQYTEDFDFNLIPKNQRWLKKYLKNIDRYDTWDYQWLYTILSNNGVSIYPNVNMIENIGFDGSGFHMKYGSHKPSRPLNNIIDPMYIEYEADKKELKRERIKKYKDIWMSILKS